MLKITFKSLLARKSRLVLSMLAIVLGIAFLSAVLTFNTMMNSTFQGIMSGTTADVNVDVRGLYSESPSTVPATPERQLNDSDVAAVARVDGVQAAYGFVQSQGTYLLDKNNKLIGNGFAPALGMNYTPGKAYLGKPGLVIRSGRAPERSGEVAIDPTSLEKGGYQLGDTMKIATSGKAGTITVTIVGTASWGSGGSAGATYAVFDTATAQQLFMDGKQQFSSIWVDAKPGVDLKGLATRIDGVVPAGYEAVDGKTASDVLSKQIGQVLSYITTFLLVFAIVGIVVSVFLIVNTFSIVVAQRSRELALMRAMGASRGQVTRSVLVEAIVLGVIGSTVGLLAGLGLAFGLVGVFQQIGFDLGSEPPQLTGSTTLACYAVGLVTTMVAAIVPAIRAGRVPPVAAINGAGLAGTSGLGKRTAIGVAMAAVGLAVFFAALFVIRRGDWLLPSIGVGAIMTLVGVAVASPVLGWPAMAIMGWLARTLFGTVGRLAGLNSNRNPRRTAATASALMIGITLVTTFGILGSSANASTRSEIDDKMKGDIIVTSAGLGEFQQSIGDDVAKIDGVRAVHRMSYDIMVSPDGRPTRIAAVAPSSFNSFWDRKIDAGSAPQATYDIAVTPRWASSHNVGVGGKVPAVLNGRPVEFTVACTFEDPSGFGAASVIATPQAMRDAGVDLKDSFLSVDLAPGANVTAIQNQIKALTADKPMIAVSTKAEYAKAQTQMTDMVLNILYALLAVAVVIAILGIINTLVLSVMERKREIGLLRAIGLNRGQLRTMIGLESVIIAVLGSILGMGMGLLFGWGLCLAMNNQGITRIEIPWGQLGMFLGASIVVGILAAIVPSVWATRVNMLKAIAAE